MPRQRLDILLVNPQSRAVARTRAGAHHGGPGPGRWRAGHQGRHQRAIGAEVTLVTPDHPFVGRGGLKLAHALDAFAIDVAGRSALDIGASTGGFTDVLLQRGARQVVALDVGHGQLDWRLRTDPRVVVVEHANARFLRPSDVPAPVDVVTIDVSFISLRHILPVVPPLLARGRRRRLGEAAVRGGPGGRGRGGLVLIRWCTRGLSTRSERRRVR